ncbi:MAG: glycosyltransferase [bacterium]
MSQALIITGMHRSGTSLVAELFRMAGVAMGDRMVPADDCNPRGYFEDVDFLALHREMVAAACLPPAASAQGDPEDVEGWPDWGWTTTETLRAEAWNRYESRAHKLAGDRAAIHPVWGWKELRTTLLLDFWHGILPNAAYAFVVREPWAVADSVRRLPVDIFNRSPDIAPRIWAFYNRRLLEFAHAHPERCVFLPIGSLTKSPHKTLDRITSRFGLAFLSHDRTNCSAVVHAALARTRVYEKDAQKKFAQEFPFADELWEQLLDAAATPSTAGIAAAPALAAAKTVAPPKPKPPRMSIIIPCYNDGRFLPDALASIEACSDKVHETIVINDGSTDPATLECLATLEPRGIRVLHGPHLGISSACNRGIREAVGEFILPISADNRIRPEYITRSIDVLDAAPDVGVVYGDPELFGDRTGHQVLPDFDLHQLHVTNYIDSSAVFRKAVWDDVGGYDTGLQHGYEDWDFWLAVARKGWKFHHIPEVMFDYRVRADSMRVHYMDLEKNRAMVSYVAAKHPYFAEHYAEILGALHARYVAALNMNSSIESETGKKFAAELEKALGELAAERARVASLEQSRSWRMTAPLRAAHGIVRGGRNDISGSA